MTDTEQAVRKDKRRAYIRAHADECFDILDLVFTAQPDLGVDHKIALASAIITSLAIADVADAVEDYGQRVVNNLVDIETAVNERK